VLVRFVLKYVRTLKVLLSPVLHSASVTVTVDSHHWLCSGIHNMFFSVRWHPFSRKLSVCYAYFKSVVTIHVCMEWKHLLTYQLLIGLPDVGSVEKQKSAGGP
jgi:hypothetical protein